uniref:Uncharacterized protein n=1 Tax=Caenorhabditis japonica TaxID=281687 RepID=A0A8R1E5G7_CAEJA
MSCSRKRIIQRPSSWSGVHRKSAGHPLGNSTFISALRRLNLTTSHSSWACCPTKWAIAPCKRQLRLCQYAKRPFA